MVEFASKEHFQESTRLVTHRVIAFLDLKVKRKSVDQSITNIKYGLCQNFGSLRSLWRAQETKILRVGLKRAPPLVQGRVKEESQSEQLNRN